MAALLQRIAQPETPPPWSLFGAVNTMFVALLAVFAATALALALIPQQAIALLIAWLIGEGIAILFILRTRAEGEDRAALRIAATEARLPIILLFSLGVAMIFDLLALGATGEFLAAQELSGLGAVGANPLAWLLVVPFMLAIQPIAEELIFRGVLYPALRRVGGPWVGLVLDAALYALFHFIIYSSPASDIWYALVAPLLAGLYFGVVRAGTGSTRAAIVAHVGFGLFALVKALVI